MLSITHRWWDLHLLLHPAGRPHLYGGKYTEDYLQSVRQDFDVKPLSSLGARLQELRTKGWFYCDSCKYKFKLKFMGERCPFAPCVRLTVIIDVRAALQAGLGQLLALLSRWVLFLRFILRGLFE